MNPCNTRVDVRAERFPIPDIEVSITSSREFSVPTEQQQQRLIQTQNY